MHAKDNAEFDATGMLKMCPVVCLKAQPSQHTYGCISNTCVGITLFVSMQGCGKPQTTDGQNEDTHVFHCVVTLKL